MRYLLDVSSLIAFGLDRHQFHARVAGWILSQKNSEFLTCSITELGFVRVLAQKAGYGFTIEEAHRLLLGLKRGSGCPLVFLADGNDISLLPDWVRSPGQITDGHLARLARSNDAVLATLDEGIPDKFFIP